MTKKRKIFNFRQIADESKRIRLLHRGGYSVRVLSTLYSDTSVDCTGLSRQTQAHSDAISTCNNRKHLCAPSLPRLTRSRPRGLGTEGSHAAAPPALRGSARRTTANGNSTVSITMYIISYYSNKIKKQTEHKIQESRSNGASIFLSPGTDGKNY